MLSWGLLGLANMCYLSERKIRKPNTGTSSIVDDVRISTGVIAAVTSEKMSVTRCCKIVCTIDAACSERILHDPELLSLCQRVKNSRLMVFQTNAKLKIMIYRLW
jgi:hypothetical protein